MKKKTAKQSKTRRPRKGLPAAESVVEEKVFLSATGKPYRILRTTEVDEYEERSEKK